MLTSSRLREAESEATQLAATSDELRARRDELTSSVARERRLWCRSKAGSDSSGGSRSSLRCTSLISRAPSSGTVLSGSTSWCRPWAETASVLPSLPLWPPRSMCVVEKERCLARLG